MGAVTTAVGIAVSISIVQHTVSHALHTHTHTHQVGLNSLLLKANGLSPAKKMMVQRFIPYPAVACASTLNTVLMRNHELREGIEVVDEQGNVVGTSKIAAKKVWLTYMSSMYVFLQ